MVEICVDPEKNVENETVKKSVKRRLENVHNNRESKKPTRTENMRLSEPAFKRQKITL